MSREGAVRQREWKVTANEWGVSFWSDENILELEVIAAQHRESAKHQ